VPDRQLPVASEAVMDAILRLADVPHSVISTGSTPTDSDQQQQQQQRLQAPQRPRGLASSPRRRVSGGGSQHRTGAIRFTVLRPQGQSC